MMYALYDAMSRALGGDYVTLAEYSEGTYQGHARIFAASADGNLFAEGSISWGSCAICDPWYDMSEDEIAADMDRQVDTFTHSQAVAYLSKIGKVDKPLSPWDDDGRWAREALSKIGA